jgi:hypothetical protein
VRPARFRWHKENILGFVFVLVLGSAPAYSPSPACSLANISSKESEMYFRKINPITTWLYSAASMFLRSLSAAFQSCFSNGSSLFSFAALAMVVFVFFIGSGGLPNNTVKSIAQTMTS